MNKIILFFIVNIVIIESIRCDVRRDEQVTEIQRRRVFVCRNESRKTRDEYKLNEMKIVLC